MIRYRFRFQVPTLNSCQANGSPILSPRLSDTKGSRRCRGPFFMPPGGQCTENVRMGFPVAGLDRLWLALVRTLQAPGLIVSLRGVDDRTRGLRGGLEQPGLQSSSSSCGVRAAASLIAASQRGR